MILPTKYKLDIHYNPQYVVGTNNGESICEYRKVGFDTMISYRYLSELKPLLCEVNGIVDNVYNIKHKYTTNTLLNGGNHKWNDNYTLYSSQININTFNGVRVYKNQKDYDLYYPIEYKHFNDSQIIMLPSELTYTHKERVIYDKLIELEKEGASFDVFNKLVQPYLQKSINNFEVTDKEKQFLFLRYKILYRAEVVGFNTECTEKLYELTYKFILL